MQKLSNTNWFRLSTYAILQEPKYRFLKFSWRFEEQVYDRVGENTLPWATPCLGPSRFFFSNEKKINIFRLMHIALFLKNHILYCFSWKVTFSMSKVNFWMFGFIETKRLNIDSFTNENWIKFKFHRSKVFRRKEEKKLLFIRYYK